MTHSPDLARLEAQKNYRLDLFLSVDVAGSTAFKFSNTLAGGQESEGETPNGWFATIRKFYDTFHETFLNRAGISEEGAPLPELWKALGDELIYRITIHDRHSAARVVKAFIEAIHHTRKVVRRLSKCLGLKGSAWIADFPARNAVIDLDGLHDTFQQQPDARPEATERRKVQDFIGPSMDAGFRLGKAASRRKMALSVELALILAMAVAERRTYPFIFGYDGREDFKGVLEGEGYPLIWLDIEDDQKQRQTNRREAAMLQRQPEVSSEVVVDFCESYIHSSYWMEHPYLKQDSAAPFDKIPQSHIDYAARELAGRAREEPLYSQDAPQEIAFGDKEITADELLSNMFSPSIRDGEPTSEAPQQPPTEPPSGSGEPAVNT